MADLDTALWTAQDALVAAWKAALAAAGERMPVDLGFPDKLEAEHGWIGGGLDEWTRDEELTGTAVACVDEAFTLRAKFLTERAGLPATAAGAPAVPAYTVARDRLKQLAAIFVTTVRSSPFLGGAVSSARITRLRLLEGRSDDGKRQVGLEVFVECTAFLG